MQTIAKTPVVPVSVCEFGSFELPRMPRQRQIVLELTILMIIAIVLPVAIVLQA
jgi:hypothetical protein